MKLLIFQATRQVILIQKSLKQEKIPFKIIPVPRSISSECGMAIEIEENYIVHAEKIANKKNIPIIIYDQKKS
ncbi:MAG: DUF3343 domain-containing protein [Spirochaetes bacterium]|nr:DUF3343 domain-containing protein [Spirochaetota bacterium]